MPLALRLVLLAIAVPALAASPGQREGEILVRFRDTAGASIAAHRAVGASVRRRFTTVRGLERVVLAKGRSLEAALAAYRADPDVLYAEPNYVVHAFRTPNDPRFAELWGLHNTGQTGGAADADIDAPEAWDLVTGSSGVVVGILDTGLDYTHPDLAPSVFRNLADCDADGVDDDASGWADDCIGIDTVNGDSDPLDDNNHGTHVAGTIGAAGNDAAGITGVAWNVRLLPCKMLDQLGNGSLADAVECIDQLRAMKAAGANLVAVNASWGGPASSSALRDAIDALRADGVLFVAAAGNDGIDTGVTGIYPGALDLPNVVSVAATDAADHLAAFSNFGARTVHLAAPGVGILSTVAVASGSYATFNGTSMAAPHVTGVAALLAAQDPTRNWLAIRNRLIVGGDVVPGAAETVSRRRLNARGALTCAGATVLARLKPTGPTHQIDLGDSVDLAALHIGCTGAIGPLDVTVTPGGEVIPLRDDGIAPDLLAGDGIYSARWTPAANGDYVLAFSPTETVTVTVGGGLPDPAPYSGHLFGRSLAPLGANVVVGAGSHFGPSGAYLYEPTTGQLLQTFPIPTPGGPEDNYGTSVATLGSDVLVGAQGTQLVEHPGAVYLFDAATGAILRTFANPAPGDDTRYGFGRSVAAVGGNVVVSAPFGYGSSAYLFDGQTAALLHTFTSPAGETPSLFASTVAVWGTKVILGGQNAAHVFEADPGSAAFGTLVTTINAPPGLGYSFRQSVAVVGDVIAFGVPLASPGPVPPSTFGAVHVFALPGGTYLRTFWNPEPLYVSPTGGIITEWFGEAVAAAGPDLLIGSTQAVVVTELGFPVERGRVYRYDLATGHLVRRLRPLFDKPSSFGAAMAAMGDTVVVGAPLENRGARVWTGGAYAFGPPAPEDPMKCYRATRGDSLGGLQLSLEDRFGTATVRTSRVRRACNPAFLPDADVADPVTGLACYKARDLGIQVTPGLIFVEGAFGLVALNLRKATELCVPATPDGSPLPGPRDAYRCYKVRSTGLDFPDQAVTDRFETGTHALRTPRTFCTPVGIGGEALVRPQSHLACYGIAELPGQPAFASRPVTFTDRFGTPGATAVRRDSLCLRVTVEGP